MKETMLEWLKNIIEKIISNTNVTTIIGFIVTILVAFVTSFFTSKRNQKEIISNYFKKESIEVQKRLLDFWTNILMFDFNTALNSYADNAKLSKDISVEDLIKFMYKECVLYSSKATLKAIGTYQQYIYKNNKIDKNGISNNDTIIKNLILPLMVTKRMKYDFTGEKISPIDLLRIKINDLDNKKIILARYYLIKYYIKENILFLLFFILSIIFIII